MQLELFVPTETIPALIGYKGQKHRDTEKATKTKLKFFKEPGAVSRISIIGSFQDCEIAKRVINIAVGHHLASVKIDKGHEEDLGPDHATQDIRAICHEIYKSKS